MIMKTIILFVCNALLICVICIGCNNVRTEAQKALSYEEATVIYPKEDGPWTAFHFFSIEPDTFIERYKGNLNAMVIKDTAFIKKLAENIESRDIMHKADTSERPFDTFLIIKLKYKGDQSFDTLALGNNLLRFNQDVYADSTTVRMITDKIIKHDKDFAENVRKYYEDGVWYPYIGKNPWQR